ncbi:MAG: TIGR02757 family protein [Candidatus Latescibacterota bacterium]
MPDYKALKRCMDKLAEEYDRGYLDTDPLGIVHGYSAPEDIETAGFIVSAIGYGNVNQIRRNALDALSRAGKSPADFARNLTPERARSIFSGWKHRWTDAEDISFLFRTAGSILNDYGSIGALVEKLDTPTDETVESVLSRFSSFIKEKSRDECGGENPRHGIPCPVPSPADGSACKRLAMYFRWMVRGPDGIDFGLWKFISPARLVIPVDIHVVRMGRFLGLTDRKIPDWKMALEITRSLRRLDRSDPVRYDFALARPGITRQCTHKTGENCTSCMVRDLCRGAGYK